jgi:hypothetical protein
MYLPLDQLSKGRERTLTLDEQRQVPATMQPRAAAAATAAPEPEPAAVSTVESTRERGSR